MKKHIGQKNLRKINVAFLINDYYLNNFITVYNLMMQSDKYDVRVIATDFYEGNNIKNKSKNIYNFLINNGIKNVIDSRYGDNYLNLEVMGIDYIFYMTPYDMYFPECYSSKRLSKKMKICHIIYGGTIIKWSGLYSYMNTNPFYMNCSFLFVENNVFDHLKKDIINVVGYVKLDDYLYYSKKYLLNNHNERIRIVWKPRWTLEEGDSNFWNYIDDIIDFIKKHPEIDFYIFFHQLFERKIHEKELEDRIHIIFNRLNKLNNYYKCSYSNFLDEVISSDIMIADYCSTLQEYTITGNPMIYCNTNIELNRIGKRIKSNSYVVNNSKELIEVLERLINGIDPLKEKRENERFKYFYIPNNMTASEKVLSIIEKDFRKKGEK